MRLTTFCATIKRTDLSGGPWTSRGFRERLYPLDKQIAGIDIHSSAAVGNLQVDRDPWLAFLVIAMPKM